MEKDATWLVQVRLVKHVVGQTGSLYMRVPSPRQPSLAP